VARTWAIEAWSTGWHTGISELMWLGGNNFLEEAEPSLLPKLLYRSPKKMLGCHEPIMWLRGWGHVVFWRSLIGWIVRSSSGRDSTLRGMKEKSSMSKISLSLVTIL